MKSRYPVICTVAAGILLMTLCVEAQAAVTIYSGKDTTVGLGGLIQLQYSSNRPADQQTSESFSARRLRLEVPVTFHKDWVSSLQIDFGQEGDQPSVLNAYVRYTGFPVGNLTAGNQTVSFSRERLTSAISLLTPERSFTGSRKYGAPARQPGISFTRTRGAVDFSVGAYFAGIIPNTDKIFFDSPINNAGQYIGPLYAGRLQYTPLGRPVPYTQSNLDLVPGLTFGVDTYHWRNNNSLQSATPGSDWNTLNGFGVDAAWRGYRKFSAYGGYTFIKGTSVDSGTTTGMIANGQARVKAWMLKGSYMVLPERLEVFASTQGISADAWTAQWKRSIVGATYFFYGNDLKVVFAIYRDTAENGIPGNDANIVYLRLQQAF